MAVAWPPNARSRTRPTCGCSIPRARRASRAASDGSITRLPVWSPDGGRIAFESVRPGSVTLSVKPSTGDGDEDVLFESPEVKIPCDWSPDGRFLMYYVPDPKTGTDLWVLPLDTRVPFVFLKTEANELWGQFSPDGRWVAYQSNETGQIRDLRAAVSRARRARFRSRRPVASIRDGLATGKSCTSLPLTRR